MVSERQYVSQNNNKTNSTDFVNKRVNIVFINAYLFNLIKAHNSVVTGTINTLKQVYYKIQRLAPY